MALPLTLAQEEKLCKTRKMLIKLMLACNGLGEAFVMAVRTAGMDEMEWIQRRSGYRIGRKERNNRCTTGDNYLTPEEKKK